MVVRIESGGPRPPKKASAGRERPLRRAERRGGRETEDSLLREKGLTGTEIPQSHRVSGHNHLEIRRNKSVGFVLLKRGFCRAAEHWRDPN